MPGATSMNCPTSTRRDRRAALTGGAVLLVVAFGGCAGTASRLPMPPSPSAAAPVQWHAPRPHSGEQSRLAAWWRRFDDPTLLQLLDAAQAASPTIAQAATRIEQARAARVAAGAALLPSVDATGAASRGRPELAFPLATSLSARLQASWEIDLFGGRRAGLEAAQARIGAATAGWHAARVSVAAEVASSYTALRACEAQLLQSRADSASRAETARLTDLTARAGFQAPADAELARASAAQSQAQTSLQASRCEREVKALVALTALAEPPLRDRLAMPIAAAAPARIPQPAHFAVASVPAEALAQRPDLLAAAFDVGAALADVAQVDAARYPRIALAGQIGVARVAAGIGSADGPVWNVGPVSVSLPIFDAGRRRADSRAARARYDEAVQLYAATLRRAVREVEEALVVLDSSAERTGDLQAAAAGFEASLRATRSRFDNGLGSLFELEDARRSALQANGALIELQRERTTAWVALYRALGGGWQADEASD